MSKLSRKQADEIRMLRITQDLTYVELARRFGVSKVSIYYVLKGRSHTGRDKRRTLTVWTPEAKDA